MMSPQIDDRELAKFRQSSGDLSKVAVTLEDGILAGIRYDDLQVEYPSTTVENYKYYLSTVLVATVEVTYSNSSKSILTRARRI
jgi:hypothetical protein